MRLSLNSLRTLGIATILSLTVGAQAATTTTTVGSVTLNTFASGDGAKASEINANFVALANAIAKLENRVAPSVTTIPGTYDILAFGADVGAGRITTFRNKGTVTLSSSGGNNTFTFSANQHLWKRNDAFSSYSGEVTMTNGRVDPEINSYSGVTGTWTYTGNTLTLTTASTPTETFSFVLHGSGLGFSVDDHSTLGSYDSVCKDITSDPNASYATCSKQSGSHEIRVVIRKP